MKKAAWLSMVMFFSCNQAKQTEAKKDTTATTTQIRKTDSEKIAGDFDGDGQSEFAFETKVKEGQGNPVEDGSADEYEINFSNSKIKSIKIGCCEPRLFNEGDLNGDGTDELSVFQDPMNGNTYMLTTFSLVGKEQWQKIIEPLLIPTENYLSDEALQKRIFLEKDTLYFLEVDVNDENFGLIKQKAVLK